MNMRFPLALLLGGIVMAATPADSFGRPVVVELFTSQGCSSCPPAETYLEKLTKRDDVLALGFHVTYWDYLGWKDPFGREQFDTRQAIYQTGWGKHSNYTPQMVVDGRQDAVGSKRSAVEKLISDAKAAQVDVPLSVKVERGKILIDVPRNAAGKNIPPSDVWVMGFDKEKQTVISRGENAGRRITCPMVVRYLAHAGQWKGEKKHLVVTPSFDEEDERPQRLAVLLQQHNQGPIMGAQTIDFH
jgi:hypothetical protein